MIVPPKLYLKRTEIPIESLLDMAEHESTWVDSGINRNGKALIDKSARSTKAKVDIRSTEYSDVAYILEQMVNIWDSILDPKLYTAKEFNYLRYGEGDKFTKHKDVIPPVNANDKVRKFLEIMQKEIGKATESNKKKCFKYLQNLVKLSEIYFN